MALRICSACAFLLLVLCGSADAAQDEFVIKNAGVARTISAFGGPLRTVKLEANGVQVIRQPGVEFIIDLDYKGEAVSLAPADFEIREVDTVKLGTELRTTLRLQCIREEIPLVMRLRYHSDPTGWYQQKSIEIEPCKKAAGAILRRIILDDQVLKPDYVPVMPAPRAADPVGTADPGSAGRFVFDVPSSFAVIDRAAGRGLFFFVTSLVGKEGVGRSGSVRMWEEMYVPLEQGYETGRATIGAVKGPAELLFKRFREFVWDNYCVARKRPMPAEGDRVAWDKADILAGKLPEPVQGGKARILVLQSDQWPVESPGKDESSYSALAACIDACGRLRETNGGDFVEMACGNALRAEADSSVEARKRCPGWAGVHWLGVVDRLDIGGPPSWHTPAGRQARYELGFILPPGAFGAQFDFGLSPDGSAALGSELGRYLAVYQHVLNYPDGKNVDGEGHIIGNKGFVVFFNPSSEARRVVIPLDEPELELKGSLKLTDLTQPGSPADIGTARVGDKVEVEVPPLALKLIGVNL